MSHLGQFSTSRNWISQGPGEGGEKGLTLVQDNFISKNLDFDRTPGAFDQSSQDLAHGLAASLDVHCADAEDDLAGISGGRGEEDTGGEGGKRTFAPCSLR